MKGVLALILMLGYGAVGAEAVSQEVIDRATAAYVAGDYNIAFATLSHLPGFLGAVPLFDHPDNHKTRAQIFFDLGRMRLAVGDTTGARLALTRAIALDAHNRRGVLPLPRDEAYEDTRTFTDYLYKQSRYKDRAYASLGGAVMRSAILPGWGQIYRGQQKRGHVFLGSAFVFAATYVVAEQTHRRSSPGQVSETRYALGDSETSRGRIAKLALAGLAGVWAANVLDHVFIGSSQVAFTFPIR